MVGTSSHLEGAATPMSMVEAYVLSDKAAELLRIYDLEYISIRVYSGIDDEEPMQQIVLANKDGRRDMWTADWYQEDE